MRLLTKTKEMADITMCSGSNCPIKDSCFRFKAEKNMIYQSYFLNVPYDHTRKVCNEHYRVRIKTK